MVSLIQRSMALGLIGTLALVIMASVPAYGLYERGPTAYGFSNTNCAGTPEQSQQQIPNATLDLGLGTCINTSDTIDNPSSVRYTCENGEFRIAQYIHSDVCDGPGGYQSYGTHLCFPGDLGAKRDTETMHHFEKSFPSIAFKRVPGDSSIVIVCNPGESWTLVENTPIDDTVPEFTNALPVSCYSPGNCTEGTAHASLYNSTDRPEPVCDQPIDSIEVMGGAIMGKCYQVSGMNLIFGCDTNSAYFGIHPYGCSRPWFQRQGQIYPYRHEQCDRVDGQDVKFFCPSSVAQPSPPPSSASAQSPHVFFFLSMALVVAASLL